MAILSYRDPGTGQWAQLDAPTGPTGSAGPTGAAGPIVVSTDAGNTATLGTDGLVFVPGLDTTAMDLDFVNLTGDTMTGELSLPDQVLVPPAVVPTAVAARGYVDQVITVSDVDPTGVPVRDGLIWNVVEEVIVPPDPTGFSGLWTDSSTNSLSWVDSTDATATYEVRYNLTGAVVGDADALLSTGIPAGVQTLIHAKDGAAQTAERVTYGIKAVNPGSSSAWVPTFVDGSAISSWPGRPPEWLPIGFPAGTDAIQVLALVPSAGEATVPFTVSGAFIVDWGDGSAPESFTAGATASHVYSYAALGNDLADGRRQAAAIITPQSGATLTSFLFVNAPLAQPIGEVVFGSGNVSSAPAFALDATDQVLVEHIEYLVPTAMPAPSRAFFGLTRLTGVTGQIDTSSATDFTRMFTNCTLLSNIPAIDFSSGTDFTALCDRCLSLTSVVLTLPSALILSYAFSNCASLVSADITSATATDCANIFYFSGALTSVSLNTPAATTFDYAFDNCISLPSVTIDTSSATTLRYMFSNCLALTTGPALNTQNVTSMEGMFNLCDALQTVPLYDTSKVTSFVRMFASCQSLTAVPAFNASTATTFDAMFSGCTTKTITTIRMFGGRYYIVLDGLGLDAASLDAFFLALGNPADPTYPYIWCDTNPGSATCHPRFATTKGWMVYE